jgi:hypothetical protein
MKSFHEKENIALEKLRGKLEDGNFWNEWELEISEWGPKCE